MTSGTGEEYARCSDRLVADRYRVLQELGKGGMGTVCRAFDEVLGREVAVKELRTFTDAAGPELAELRSRMRREARAAARIRHPGVVAVHDVTEQDGRPVIVMELVDGPSLGDVLRDGGALDPHEAAAVGAKVAAALDAAHRAGVLHRDVKPANILLGPEGRVVLTDFGIASMDDPGDDASTRLTRSGALVGSLEYLAPERAQGREPEAASDVWALGATLYAAVEGTSPFQRSSTWTTLTAIVSEPLPEPRRCGPLAPVLRALMDKDPEARPTAERARDLLAAVADRAPLPGARDTVRLGRRDRAALPVPAAAPEPDVEPAPEPVAESAPGPVAESAPGPVAESAPGPAPQPVQEPLPVPEPLPVSEPRPGTSDVRRRTVRRRAALAAVAAVVVLGAAAATSALVSGGGERGPAAAAGGGRIGAVSTGTPPARGGASTDDQAAKPSAGAGGAATLGPAGGAETPGKAGGSESGPAAAGRTPGTVPGAAAGATAEPTPGASAPPAGAAACGASGDGWYDCVLWRAARTYDDSGARVGRLKKGTHRFSCQADLGRRETQGKWTNVWWARTEDAVWVSDVYIQGGANDEPVPGLPTC